MICYPAVTAGNPNPVLGPIPCSLVPTQIPNPNAKRRYLVIPSAGTFRFPLIN